MYDSNSGYEVCVYSEEGGYVETKEFTDLKEAREWIARYNRDMLGCGFALPYNFY